jgi:hypothetical protein
MLTDIGTVLWKELKEIMHLRDSLRATVLAMVVPVIFIGFFLSVNAGSRWVQTYESLVMWFLLAFIMIVVGVLLCLYSVYDRMKNAEERARRFAQEILRNLTKEGITTSPIPLADLNNIIEAIMKIKNPFMQVGVYLSVFGIILMIISIFIPF